MFKAVEISLLHTVWFVISFHLTSTHFLCDCKKHERSSGTWHARLGRSVPGVCGFNTDAPGSWEWQRCRNPQGHPGSLQRHGGQSHPMRTRYSEKIQIERAFLSGQSLTILCRPSALVISVWIVKYMSGFHLAGVSTGHGARHSLILIWT